MEAPTLEPNAIGTETSVTETSVADPVAIEPEETAEEPEGAQLDQEIP